MGDCSELRAIKSVFGGVQGPAVSAAKSSTGHLLGAAGGIEAIFTALAVRDQIAPATLNLENPDTESAGVNIVSVKPLSLEIDYAMSNGFGFGG